MSAVPEEIHTVATAEATAPAATAAPVPSAAPVASGQSTFFSDTIELRTLGAGRLHDLTDDIAGFLERAGIGWGMVMATALHTTAGLLINERERGLQEDFIGSLDRWASREVAYRHDDMETRTENLCPEDFEAPNGHSHLQHMVVGSPCLVVAAAAGQLVLGRWQRIFLVEFDRPRVRRVALQAVGIGGSPSFLETREREWLS
jgi:secondary thiamine-phosphate synthase enzyme